MVDIPSPAVAVVGRHNSGKTTLVVKLIEELTARGRDVGSVKHHHRLGFEFDIPGKDSYRHRHAGATETVIAAPDQIARVRTLSAELECASIVQSMPGHDVVIVEGYRKSGLPTIEVMRAENEADAAVARAFAEGAKNGEPLGTDFIQKSRGERAFEFEEGSREADFATKMPTANTIAVVTDISQAQEAAEVYGIPHFHPDDVRGIADFLEAYYVRPKVTVVIQAGGESRRMGQSKALVPFAGRPLICRMIDRLSPVADELIITTNEGERLAFLAEDYPELDIRLVPDLHDFRGALPGIHTALDAASNPFVALVACDMLFASPRLVVAEAIALKESGADAVIPVNKHGYEPFHAIYRRSACLPAVLELLDAGDKRAQSFFDRVNVREYEQSEVLRAEPMGGCFINANTPEELHALEEAFLEE
ncbi:MAG: molybdopterin-guanine dinucleotide biosynthesis protein B [Eggerthellaceae bacterium]|nr:molybdopterin-guanine dinucleotide biosynthesis protein B [Eggerthellaceae bacterium]